MSLAITAATKAPLQSDVFAAAAVGVPNTPCTTIFESGVGYSRVLFGSPQTAVAGVNENKLCCAVLPAYAKGQTAVGDLCREILSSCETAEDALDLAKLEAKKGISLIALIDGADGKYIFEMSAGAYAARRIDDFYVTAGEFTLGDEEISGNYNGKDFAKDFGDARAARKAGAEYRRFDALQTLYNAQNGAPVFTLQEIITSRQKRDTPSGLNLNAMLSALRSHAFSVAGADCVCLHSPKAMTLGGIAYDRESGITFVQLGSVACMSLFVPVSLENCAVPSDSGEAFAMWKKCETVVRAALCGKLDTDAYLSERDSIENGFLSRLSTLAADGAAHRVLYDDATAFFDKWYAIAVSSKRKEPFAWKKLNEELAGL